MGRKEITASYTNTIIEAVKDRSPEFPLTGNRIAELLGKKQTHIKSTLATLARSERIGRIKADVFYYYDAKFIKNKANGPDEINGLMPCMLRYNNRKIDKSTCVPNPEAKECNICKWGEM